MSAPQSHQRVWLANCDSQVAHSVRGGKTTLEWRTPCGEVIGVWNHPRPPQFHGEQIRWGHLNHALVALCKKCYR